MCGICGFVSPRLGWREPQLRSAAEGMAQLLSHRGPDGHGSFADLGAGLGLAHRRLSIIDLSPEGAQPMRSHDGRLALVFNGEIYNFADLRAELQAQKRIEWKGHSDTEVMLEAMSHWGVTTALQKFNGMFGFALWDSETRSLTLARDRMGEKPLYYGWIGETFAFASELKALRGHPNWQTEVDRDSLGLMLRFGYVPSPRTIYRGIYKLPPASVLRFEAGKAELRSKPSIEAYWSARDAAERGRDQPFHGTPAEAIDELERILSDAVRLRMIADVPLGAFLSGGIDSSLVVALMQAHSPRPVQTFTIGFEDPAYDEAPFAAAVAMHLGTDHNVEYFTASEALRALPDLPAVFDEPFGDPSQLPTYLLAALARKKVTVALSGDAGDELFLGYDRYRLTLRLWAGLRFLPRRARAAIAVALASAPLGAIDASAGWLSSGNRRIGDRLAKASDFLAVGSGKELYRHLTSQWYGADRLAIGANQSRLMEPVDVGEEIDLATWMGYTDSLTYLPDDILVKVDRAAMASSLETRIPLLDPRVVDFAWSLPLDFKMRRGRGKWLLRQLLDRHVPRPLVDRPKRGFGIPLADWLRGPLRSWADEHLDPVRLRSEGYLDADQVQLKWREHLDGGRNWSNLLWNVLAFQAWLAANGES